MKLLNHTLKYLAFIFPLIIAIWAGLFYYNMVDEVQDSIDDGLENYKILILKNIQNNQSIETLPDFQERHYTIQELPERIALSHTDLYTDTLMYLLSEEDFEPVRMLTSAFKHQDKYYQLRVISTNLEHDDLMEELFYSILWLYAILLISVLFINNWVLKKTWKPFYSILKGMKAYSLEKNKSYQGVDSKVFEFKELDYTVNELIRRIERGYDNQKQFLENASHEIQTPLAISMNKIELLLEQESLSNEDYPKLIQIFKNLQRLSRLNKSLLLISKIENNQYVNTESLAIVDFLRNLVEDFRDYADSKGKKIEFKVLKPESETEDFWEINKDLAFILFNNLIKNAINHSPAESTILVEIHSDKVEISNSGTQTLDLNRVFERFHKESVDPNRTGLGLAISKSIADVSHLSLQYRFESSSHIFSLKKFNKVV